MNKWIEILLGLVLIIIAVLVWAYTLGTGFWDFGTAAWELVKGAVIWLVILIGLVLLLLGINDLKD